MNARKRKANLYKVLVTLPMWSRTMEVSSDKLYAATSLDGGKTWDLAEYV
jgi:hypothetical protein